MPHLQNGGSNSTPALLTWKGVRKQHDAAHVDDICKRKQGSGHHAHENKTFLKKWNACYFISISFLGVILKSLWKQWCCVQFLLNVCGRMREKVMCCLIWTLGVERLLLVVSHAFFAPSHTCFVVVKNHGYNSNTPCFENSGALSSHPFEPRWICDCSDQKNVGQRSSWMPSEPGSSTFVQLPYCLCERAFVGTMSWSMYSEPTLWKGFHRFIEKLCTSSPASRLSIVLPLSHLNPGTRLVGPETSRRFQLLILFSDPWSLISLRHWTSWSRHRSSSPCSV